MRENVAERERKEIYKLRESIGEKERERERKREKGERECEERKREKKRPVIRIRKATSDAA